MLELILSAAFVLILTIYAAASTFLTEKIKDIANVSGKAASYVTAFISSGFIVYLSKLIGVSGVFTLLLGLGYEGDIPSIPPEATLHWWYYIIIHIASFSIAGGIYDWRKLLPSKK